MSGFTSTLRAVLDMDISPFRKNAKAAEGVAGELGKNLGRKLGAGDAFKGLLTAFTISIEGIAGTLASVITSGSKEGWENAAKAASEYDKQLEKIFLKSRTASQQSTYYRQQQADLTREANAPRKQLAGFDPDRPIMSAFNMLGPVQNARKLINRAGWFGAETEADAETRRSSKSAAAAEAGQLAIEAEKTQRALNEAIADELTARNLIGKEEGAQIVAGRKKYQALIEEAALLKKTDAVGAAQKELEASKQLTAERRILWGIEKSRRDTQEQLDDMQKEAAALLESGTEKIIRLRSDALRLELRSADTSRTVAEQDKDRVASQKLLNDALAQEYKLRSSNLSLAQTGSLGRGSERGSKANEAQRLYARADRASAQGNFAYGEQLRGRAQAIEDGLNKQESTYLKKERTTTDTRSEWDKKYGAQLQGQRDNLDYGIGMGKRAARGTSRLQQIKEGDATSSGAGTTSAKTELTSALDASTVLKSIDANLQPVEATTT